MAIVLLTGTTADPLTSTWSSGRSPSRQHTHDGVVMKRYILAGLVLALVTTLVVVVASPELQAVALLGAALGGTLGLVPKVLDDLLGTHRADVDAGSEREPDSPY